MQDAHTGPGRSTPDNQSVRRTNSRVNSTHLPTPTTAVRKRPAVPAAQRAGDTSPMPHVNRKAAHQSSITSKKLIVLCDIDLTLSDSDDNPLEVLPQSKKSDKVLEAQCSPATRSLPTPSSRNVVANMHVKNVYTGPTTPASNVRKTALPRISPQCFPTAARGVPAHKFANIPPLSSVTPSARTLPHVLPLSPTRGRLSKSTSEVFTVKVSGAPDGPLSSNRTFSGSHSSDRPDDDNPFDSTVCKDPSAIHGQRKVYQSPSAESSTVTLDTSDTPTEINIPVQAVASSQSQYLLSIEATPKRNRSHPCHDFVPGSQTQEEGELFIGMQPFSVPNRATEISVGNQKLTLERAEEASRTLSPFRVHTPRLSGTALNASSEGTRQVVGPSPSSRPPVQCRKADRHRSRTRSYSPSSNTLSRQDSMNVPSILSDDSATEPESDTEIRNCAAQIAQKRADRAPTSPRGALRPFVSPLVSPVRQRYTPEPSVPSSLGALMEDGVGLSVPMSNALSRFHGMRLRRQSDPSDSLPSVARNFMDMFKGDGSYPDDFPNSLRV